MPGTVALVSTIAATLSSSVLGATLIYYGVSAAIYAGLSIGLSLLSNALFKPSSSASRPEDVQQSTRQPLQSRFRHYGKGKYTGPWAFADSKDGWFYKVVMLGTGEFSQIHSFWIDDVEVTINGSNVASGGRFSDIPEANRPLIEYRIGADSQTFYSNLGATFSEWDSDCKGNGIASIFATQKALNSDQYVTAYPNGINTTYKVIADGVKVKNPITSVVEWSDNPSSIILDYLTHPDAMRLPTAIFNTTQSVALWQAAYTASDVQYDLKAGGTEDRYRLWGSYRLDERPADVLNRMLLSCDGRLKFTNDGGMGLEVGDWYEPTVTLTKTHIVSISELSRGRDILTTANTIRADFLNPDEDYQTGDADPWIDADDVSQRGEIASDASYIMSPSHAQARRLMKIESYRLNPRWVGTITCNLAALYAFGERFIRFNYERFSINEVFEVLDFRFDIGQDGILQTVTLQIQSMPAEAYEWDEDDEEGVAPVRQDVTVDRSIPTVTNFGGTIERKNISGALVPYALLTFDAAPSGLKVEAEGKLDADSTWTPINVTDGETSAESFLLSDGEDYNFRARHSTLTNRKSDWTTELDLASVGDPTAPAVVNTVVGTGGAGTVNITWNSPNSDNYNRTNIYRHTSDVEGSATFVDDVFGAANSSFSFDDNSLSSGTYYYWLRAANSSNVESASVATGSVTVT